MSKGKGKKRELDDTAELACLVGFKQLLDVTCEFENLVGAFLLPEAGVVKLGREVRGLTGMEWVDWVRGLRIWPGETGIKWNEEGVWLCELGVSWRRGILGKVSIQEIAQLERVRLGQNGAFGGVNPRNQKLVCTDSSFTGVGAKCKGKVGVAWSNSGAVGVTGYRRRVFEGWDASLAASVYRPGGWEVRLSVGDPEFLEKWRGALGVMDRFYERQEYYARTSKYPPKWASELVKPV